MKISYRLSFIYLFEVYTVNVCHKGSTQLTADLTWVWPSVYPFYISNDEIYHTITDLQTKTDFKATAMTD